MVLALAAMLALTGAARADDPENCLLCHQYRGLARYDADKGKVHLFYVNPEYHRAQLGPHARLACTDCHQREQVAVIPHRETTPVDCTRTCHLSNPQGLERRFSHENVKRMLGQSAHAPEVLAKLPFAGGPLLEDGQSLCLLCHDEPLFRDPLGVLPVLSELGSRAFDRCDVCHLEQIPVDVAYSLRHIASRLQPARPTLELAQVCAVCHSDPGVLAEYGMHDAVASYLRSFHGKAAMLGNTATADCLACHVLPGENAHLMLGSANTASSVHPTRVADSCRTAACHPGAQKSIGAATMHLDLATQHAGLEFVIAAAFILLTVLTFGPSMAIVVLELFAMLIGRHPPDHERMTKLARDVLEHHRGRQLLMRFTPHQRVQHWLLAVLFTLLALTGFPMKFADQAWAKTAILAFGGLDVSRLLHHWAGLVLFAGAGYHMLYVAYTMWRQRVTSGQRRGLVGSVAALPMWLTMADARKAVQLLAYLLFLRRDPPAFGRFGVKDKFEYIGVFWGTALLGVTGALLWGEQILSQMMSGRVLNIALIAHTYEAFLAVIHVGILHIINVVLSPNVFPLSRATLDGLTPPAELAENHAEQVLDVARELDLTPAGEEH